MAENKKLVLYIIPFLIVTAIVMFYIWYDLGEDLRELDYSMPIDLNNATEYDMVVSIFPIATSSGKVIEVRTHSNQTSRLISPFPLASPSERTTTHSVDPPVTSYRKVMKRGGIEQIRQEKNSSEHVFYYLGEEVDSQNIIVCVIAWKISGSLDFSVLQEEPYFVQTIYKPEYKIGPEEYGTFASVTIE